MLREMRPSELGAWLAFNRSDPWGEQRADLRMAIIASTVANALAKKRDGGSFKPRDFMPYLERNAGDDGAELSRRIRATMKLATKRKA